MAQIGCVLLSGLLKRGKLLVVDLPSLLARLNCGLVLLRLLLPTIGWSA